MRLVIWWVSPNVRKGYIIGDFICRLMGLNENKGRSIKYIPILAMVLVAAGVTIVITSQEAPHESGFTLDEIDFFPSNSLDISDGGDVIDEQLRGELNNSTFTLVFDIKQTSYHWVQSYTYEHRAGRDVLDLDQSDGQDMIVTDWEYDQRYDFTVQFLCDSDYLTVRSLQYFDEALVISGSFVVRNRQIDEVVFNLDDDREFEDRGRQWIVYFGEADPSGGIDSDALVIEVKEEGKAWSN